MPKESRLQRRIQRAIRAAFPGAYVRKIHGSEFQSGGIADLLCCIHSLFVALEVKTEDGDPSELQLNELEEVRDAGGLAIIVRSPEEAITKITRHLEKFNDTWRILPRGSHVPHRSRDAEKARGPRPASTHGGTSARGGSRAVSRVRRKRKRDLSTHD